ncbi:hypothetical protein [Halalkalibacillus halophilus]|uniref:hypothetical protein n=1 Tax=Halalkalibacillus halophilus TaxID=392827 RepID=UPI0003FC2462|nr:hypothetical protein [Halalkalibacillus halophilus]
MSTKEKEQVQDQEQAINSEQVFDMLPYVADLYEKSGFDSYRKEIRKKYQGKKNVDSLDPAIDAVRFILKNSNKVKDEFFNIVAIAEERKVEEVKKQSYIKTMRSIKRIFSDPDLVDFFKEAMQ